MSRSSPIPVAAKRIDEPQAVIVCRDSGLDKGGGWGGDEDEETVESVMAGGSTLGDTDPKPLDRGTVVLLRISDPGHADLYVEALLDGFPNQGEAV